MQSVPAVDSKLIQNVTPTLALEVQHALWLDQPLLVIPVFLVPQAAYSVPPFLMAVKSQYPPCLHLLEAQQCQTPLTGTVNIPVPALKGSVQRAPPVSHL